MRVIAAARRACCGGGIVRACLRKFLLLQIKIDGVEHAIDADPQMPLLGAIRDIVGLTGTKIRLRGRRLRACTVHIDGQAVRSCLTTLANAQGRRANPSPPSTKVRRGAALPFPETKRVARRA